jgi:hypothetical protein
MSAAIIARAHSRGLTWLAKRGKTVSKHVSHHTHSAVNAAARNPRYMARVLGRSAHSVFRDPRPYKLIEDVLKKPTVSLMQRNGYVLVERQFNKAVGKAGETIVRVIIDPRTGRIITAFPVLLSATAARAAETTTVENVMATALDDNVVDTIIGIERLQAQWELEKPQAQFDVWTVLIDLLLAPEPAGDEDETLNVRVYNFLERQVAAAIAEVEQAVGRRLSTQSRRALREQFLDAVAGAAAAEVDD